MGHARLRNAWQSQVACQVRVERHRESVTDVSSREVGGDLRWRGDGSLG